MESGDLLFDVEIENQESAASCSEEEIPSDESKSRALLRHFGNFYFPIFLTVTSFGLVCRWLVVLGFPFTYGNYHVGVWLNWATWIPALVVYSVIMSVYLVKMAVHRTVFWRETKTFPRLHLFVAPMLGCIVLTASAPTSIRNGKAMLAVYIIVVVYQWVFHLNMFWHWLYGSQMRYVNFLFLMTCVGWFTATSLGLGNIDSSIARSLGDFVQFQFVIGSFVLAMGLANVVLNVVKMRPGERAGPTAFIMLTAPAASASAAMAIDASRGVSRESFGISKIYMYIAFAAFLMALPNVRALFTSRKYIPGFFALSFPTNVFAVAWIQFATFVYPTRFIRTVAGLYVIWAFLLVATNIGRAIFACIATPAAWKDPVAYGPAHGRSPFFLEHPPVAVETGKVIGPAAKPKVADVEPKSDDGATVVSETGDNDSVLTSSTTDASGSESASA